MCLTIVHNQESTQNTTQVSIPQNILRDHFPGNSTRTGQGATSASTCPRGFTLIGAGGPWPWAQAGRAPPGTLGLSASLPRGVGSLSQLSAVPCVDAPQAAHPSMDTGLVPRSAVMMSRAAVDMCGQVFFPGSGRWAHRRGHVLPCRKPAYSC